MTHVVCEEANSARCPIRTSARLICRHAKPHAALGVAGCGKPGAGMCVDDGMEVIFHAVCCVPAAKRSKKP